jgi:hypothetical protein
MVLDENCLRGRVKKTIEALLPLFAELLMSCESICKESSVIVGYNRATPTFQSFDIISSTGVVDGEISLR